MVVQWLGLSTSVAMVLGSVSGWRAKIPTSCTAKKKEKKKRKIDSKMLVMTESKVAGQKLLEWNKKTFAHLLSTDTLTFQEFLKTTDAHVLSRVWLFLSLNAAHQVPLSMGFSRQEYWSELPFPPPGDFPDTEIEPVSPASPASPAFASGFFHSWASWEV